MTCGSEPRLQPDALARMKPDVSDVVQQTRWLIHRPRDRWRGRSDFDLGHSPLPILVRNLARVVRGARRPAGGPAGRVPPRRAEPAGSGPGRPGRPRGSDGTDRDPDGKGRGSRNRTESSTPRSGVQDEIAPRPRSPPASGEAPWFTKTPPIPLHRSML